MLIGTHVGSPWSAERQRILMGIEKELFPCGLKWPRRCTEDGMGEVLKGKEHSVWTGIMVVLLGKAGENPKSQ